MTSNGTAISPNLRALIQAAEHQSWSVKRRNDGKLVWSSPDPMVGAVYSPAQIPSDDDHAIQNLTSDLARCGLSLPPVDPGPFGREMIGRVEEIVARFEQEWGKRSGNLLRQIEALKDENADLRQRLADAQHGVEQRAREAAQKAAQEAVERLLAEMKS